MSRPQFHQQSWHPPNPANIWPILFNQPDFVSRKRKLEEIIEKRGHICDFYPKFHCEPNFIEQYWGAAKYEYQSKPHPSNFNQMEQNAIASLDSVPLL